jgi:hypothetical protein
MKKSSLFAVAAGVVLFNLASSTQAAIISPGQSVVPPTLAQEGVLGAANFDMVPFTPFSDGTATGMYREFVSLGRPGNPFSGLSFEYQIKLTSGLVQTFTASGFGGWQTNVTFAPAGTVPASAVARSAGTGDQISFTLDGGGVQAGQTSMWLIVDTNAPADIGNAIQFSVGDFATPPLAALGPASAPEPGTLTLACICLLGGGAYGWKGKAATASNAGLPRKPRL